MSDANKTELTKRVTAAVVSWLGERGFRPIESEVTVSRGWLADVAGFAYLTRTEAKRLNLLDAAPKWTPDDKDGWKERHAEWLSRIEALPQPITAAIEVKISTSDFRRDRKFAADAPVHLMYLAMPRGLIEPTAVNERWGILAFDSADGKVKRIRRPQMQTVTTEQVLCVVADVAMRRDNFTQYERYREFDRQAREHHNERENRHRYSGVVSAVLAVQSGRYGIDESFRVHCGRDCKLPKYVREQLEKLIPIPRPMEQTA